MNGRPRSDGGGDEWKKYVKAFDAFPKQREEAAEFFHRSVSGGVITIVTAILMGLLFLSELGMRMIIFYSKYIKSWQQRHSCVCRSVFEAYN